MRRSGRQEFTRAEALLAGKRVDAKGKQEQEGIAKSKPTTRASSSSTLCLTVIPTDSDLSNPPSSKSPCVGREETENGGPADTSQLAQPGSRFLKQKPQKVEVGIQQAGLGPVRRVGLGADSESKGRSNAILRKLAQIENKIQSRKTKQSMEWIPVMDVELSLSESSKDLELRTEGLKFLKKKTARLKEGVKAQMKNVTLADVTGDSEEDADRYRQEVPQKSKGQEDKFKFQPNRKLLPETFSSSRFLPEESQENRPLYHSPYSPNRDTRASHVASCSSSPSMKYSPADTMSHNRSSNYQNKSLSERSIIRSLDELFSEVTDVHNDISSNSDFRVNILSLDELEPCRKTELKEEVIQAVEKSNKNLGGTVQSPAKPQSLFKTSAVSLEEEENLEETEISEQLSSSSAGYSPCEEEYSEDFEPSSFFPTSKETGESTCENRLMDASVHSIQSNLPSPCCPSVAPEGNKVIKKIEVKEVAVQTGSFSLAYHSLQYDVPAVVGHAIQQNSAEAPCISSHKLNMEVIEALSVYNPSISALNNMLKQNLLLIQQSIELNRHLHASFVASLEEEKYHYHTLEEAKMYIQQHKPLPLTMEQALQELKEYEQMASWAH